MKPRLRTVSSPNQLPEYGLRRTSFLDTLSIDTGSANTFVGADRRYVPTSSSMNTTQPVVRSFLHPIPLLEIFALQNGTYGIQSFKGKRCYFLSLILTVLSSRF